MTISKNHVNKFLAKFGYAIRKFDNYQILPHLINRFYHKDFYFLQIGANDGVSFDPIHDLVKGLHLSGIVVEPVPAYYSKLCTTYKRYPNVKPVNKAVVNYVTPGGGA